MNQLTKIEKELIKNYSEDFFNKTGKHVVSVQVENHWANVCDLNKKLHSSKILQLIEEVTGWNMEFVLVNKNKKIHNVHKRQVVYFILFNNGFNMCQIGRMFQKDHTTVLHSLRTFEYELDTDPYIGKLLSQITDDIRDLI